MNSVAKVAVVIALVAAVGLVFAVKQGQKADDGKAGMTAKEPGQVVGAAPNDEMRPGGKLPKMIDLGAGQCIPCKAMKPILDDLRVNYADYFETIFIDVWEDPAKGRAHGIRTIPTQIFYDAEGKELFRHEGFYG